MTEIQGTYNTAKIYTNSLEASAEGQIRAMCNQPFCEGSRIRIMPDVHVGKGCCIGTTMTIGKYVVPNMVGTDIGCGMLTVKLAEKRINLPELDSFIHNKIPSGRAVRERRHRSHGRIDISQLRCYKKVDTRRALESLGTLGRGNHFIEVDKDEEDELYLVIHTGSRNLGLRVAEYYQNKAYNTLGGRKQDDIPYELAYLTGEDVEDYLHDMELMQRFAALNRQIIAEEILSGMKLNEAYSFSTVHNYIDLGQMILRKGAVSANMGERLIIPMNMRDGSLICVGLGNAEWNFSAPHGAGRLMNRADAKKSFTVSAFRKEMDGIFTSCISPDTLDECPMVYKPMENILSQITETVSVVSLIRPIYNFKADGGSVAKRR